MTDPTTVWMYFEIDIGFGLPRVVLAPGFGFGSGFGGGSIEILPPSGPVKV